MASFRSSAAYRIAVTYTVICAWTILLLGAGTWYVADREIRRERDLDIVGELDRISQGSRRTNLKTALRQIQTERADGRFKYALFDSKRRRVGGNLEISRPGLGFQNLMLASADDAEQSVRIGAIDLADGTRLAVASDASELDEARKRILLPFLAAFCSLLAVNVIGGFWLRRYLVNRLKPITATADAIVTGDIEWRVPVASDGDEFDEAGRAFNLMLDRIAGLMENLRQVSSDIAHDLRKPLIRLLLQTDRLGRTDGAEQRVLELGDEMLMLFTSILRIAEVEGGGLERSFERVELSALMEEVAESFAPALVDSGHAMDWVIEPDLEINGNRELLAQLATNLLDNARIHTPAGTAIQLNLESEMNVLRLSVEDNGPGVAEAELPKLLQRFFRSEASRTTAGNGLGLSLVAAVAHAHGGEVSVENAAPGLRIVVTLPRSDS